MEENAASHKEAVRVVGAYVTSAGSSAQFHANVMKTNARTEEV